MKWIILIVSLLMGGCGFILIFLNKPPEPVIEGITKSLTGCVKVSVFADDPEESKVAIRVDFGDGYVL